MITKMNLVMLQWKFNAKKMKLNDAWKLDLPLCRVSNTLFRVPSYYIPEVKKFYYEKDARYSHILFFKINSFAKYGKSTKSSHYNAKYKKFSEIELDPSLGSKNNGMKRFSMRLNNKNSI